MILEGEYLQKIGKKEGVEVTFRFTHKFQLALTKNVKTDKLYRVEIEEIKDRRTLRQNRYMWAVLKEIALAVNGDYKSEEIYCMAIELANIRSYDFTCTEDAMKSLKSKFRVVKPFNRYEEKGVTYVNCRVYRGSSDMDTKEMTVLIDTILDISAKAGLDTNYWKGLLYEE